MRLTSLLMASRPSSFICKPAMMLAPQTMFSLQSMDFSRAVRQRAKLQVHKEVKKQDTIEAYFDKLMRRRQESDKGVINLPRHNFEDVMNHHVKTEEDYEALLVAFYNYVGHRNTFPQNSTDDLLKKALKMEKPELAFILIENHAELLIHPQAKIMRSFLNMILHEQTFNYDKLKSFFAVTKGKYLLQRPANLNRTVIEKAHEAGDKETIIEAYLDILDYDRELDGVDASFFEKVLESMTYTEAVDHVLFGHIKEQMDARGLKCNLYSAVYYLNANGGLTSADLIKEMAADSSITKIANSELFKTEFISQVLPGEEAEDQNPLKLDDYVLEQVQLALKLCKDKVDTTFYESAASYLKPTPEPVAEAETEAVEEPEATEVPAEEASASEEQTKEQ